MPLNKMRVFTKQLFSTALSGLVAVAIILVLSVAIGVSVYISIGRVFEASRPPVSSAEVRVVCYLITSNSSYLCLASNPLEHRVTLKLYLQDSEKALIEELEPLSVKPLFCSNSLQKCVLVSKRILYANAMASSNGGQRLRVSVVYR